MKKIIILITFLLFNYLIGYAQLTTLLNFTGITNGSEPQGSLISDGTFLYGMTELGGANDSGTIFKIKPDGTSYIKLLDFAGVSNGSNPFGSLFYDGTFLYGMTSIGGTNNLGAIFRIKPDGSSDTILLNFTGTTNGSNPRGSLISDGTYLYGMTSNGGANGDGTIFKIKPDGTGYLNLLNFAGTTNGELPFGSLYYDGTYLYGMTAGGGTSGGGVIFKIKPDGTAYANILNFAGSTNGGAPYGSLISDGTYLYGMASQKTSNFIPGTIFKIMPDGTGYTDLLDFTNTNGSYPQGSLTYDGIFLYGMTEAGGASTNCGTSGCGTIFKIKPDGSSYADLLDFAGTTNGSNPVGSFISVGTYLYGTTSAGGANNMGTIFKYQYTTVGIEQYSINNDINIYPNPSNDNVTIQSNTELGGVTMYNMLGELIYSQTTKENTTQIDVSQQAAGVYLIKVQNQIIKLIKQ